MTVNVGPKERLTGTFLLSAIFYAVLILGIGFSLNKAAPISPSLDVILSPTASAERPDRADFLAQVNNQGGGREQTPQRPKDDQLSQSPQDEPGDAPVAVRAQQTPPEPEAVQRTLSSLAPSQRRQPMAQEQRPNSHEPLPAGQELIEQSLSLARLANEYSQKQALQARRNRSKFITASTREYVYAQYMNDWVRRVERVGNANYPAQAFNGQLILTVAIRRDGRIEHVTVVKSSGHKILDRAAIEIVKLAEPFARLPESADNPDVLYITRTWQFIAGQARLN